MVEEKKKYVFDIHETIQFQISLQYRDKRQEILPHSISVWSSSSGKDSA